MLMNPGPSGYGRKALRSSGGNNWRKGEVAKKEKW